ncbi:hypothetical protein SC22_11515 [Bacillus sp. A053]|nr:hypothetical protein CDO84_09275 [Bacillus sp. MD-5]KIH39299.1 hypothetical protein SC22_11515 [Bacillus sp. A053]OIS62579.1 hypothetical protein A4A36_06870 [Bacillus subtilis]POO80449.1 hypothetical protein C1T30_23885 [Bacillus sp. MBGLi97]OIS65235.1 hypothetical protein A4A37_02475 [Bacillus subtilis]
MDQDIQFLKEYRMSWKLKTLTVKLHHGFGQSVIMNGSKLGRKTQSAILYTSHILQNHMF